MPVAGSSTAGIIWSGPGSEVKTISLASATARGSAATAAPRPANAAVAAGRMSQTVSEWPASIRQPAIGVPIVPVPMNPICIASSLRPLLRNVLLADGPHRASRLLCAREPTRSQPIRRKSMQIGFNLPISGPLAEPATVTRMAQEGEALGYDDLTLTDHI